MSEQKNSYIDKSSALVLPITSMCSHWHAIDGYETYLVDANTIGVRPIWYDVKDRLPKFNAYVLVLANFKRTDEPKPIAIARLEPRGAWEFLSAEVLVLYVGAWKDIEHEMDSDDITHWMELPKPPEIKNE